MVHRLGHRHLYRLFEEGLMGRNIFYDEESGRFFTENSLEIYNIHQIVPPWALLLAQEAKKQGYPYFEFFKNSEVIRIVW